MFFKLVLNQARHKWGINLMIFLALTTVVSLYVYLKNTSQFANRSMQLIMKNMGHNLLLLPDEANPYDTYLCTEQQILFSDNITRELAKHTHLASRYYVSMLQKRITLDNHELILTGIEPVKRKDETREKGNLLAPIKPGFIRLGSTAAKQLKLTGGMELAIHNRKFQVSEILQPKGTIDDFRIYVELKESQDIFEQPGKINAILAFACLHVGNLEETEAFQKVEIPKIAPGFKQITKTDIFQGRYLARMTTQGSLRYLLIIVLSVVVLLIAITGFQEVAERRRELGILVSMGANYLYITSLYFVKIVIIALCASVAGFLIGSQLSISLNSPLLFVHTAQMRILWNHLPNVIYLTCAIALAAELLPIIKLVRMDPTATLIED